MRDSLPKAPQQFPEQDTEFYLNGEAGLLEAIANPIPNSDNQFIAVICHPHPLHGGTMNNKVVTTIMRAFKDVGIASVRFNYRGVENSQGEFGDGIGELQDLKTVVAWTQSVLPQAQLVLAGFSFGSRIAAGLANEIPTQALINVAPAVNHADYTSLTNIQCPWLVVQGEQDEIIPPELVYAWADQHRPQPLLKRLPEASHFFHGKLIPLRHLLVDFLEQSL